MKKRFLSLLCILAFALPFVAATPCFADTGETTIGQITYRYDTETDEAMVTHADSGISGDVEIPGTIEVEGKEYAVTSIGNVAFSGCSSLTEVAIPESVTSIGDHAFAFCFSLTQIAIPEGVTSIGEYAFTYCSSLTEVAIPESVTSIGDNAFYGCVNLTNVYVREDLSLGTGSFLNVSQGVHVWCYKVLKNAEVSEDGKVHVAIVSVEGKDGTDITASLAISDGAMGDGYVIDEVKPSNLTL